MNIDLSKFTIVSRESCDKNVRDPSIITLEDHIKASQNELQYQLNSIETSIRSEYKKWITMFEKMSTKHGTVFEVGKKYDSQSDNLWYTHFRTQDERTIFAIAQADFITALSSINLKCKIDLGQYSPPGELERGDPAFYWVINMTIEA